ncbi:hypothetical protein BX666DRAFT_1513859 [Dichotomocladium elegans]|nr:hypothetical protein BX666DRAFT_1513859 [Dichotomocladium elegans]
MMNNQHSLSASLSISDDRSDVIKRQRETVRKGHTQRAPWTPAEDNLLRLAVQLYGDKTEKWSKIAACVPGRTNKNCRKRWFHSLDPSLRKGAWTDEEDQLLRDGVMKYPNQWSKIADMLEGRTDDQCAKRWRESLDPNIDRSDWTAAEDQLLMNKYEEFGSQWQKIAQFFEGRPGLHCRNRWRKLQRLVQMKKDKEEAAASMIPFVDGLPEHMQRTSALHFNSSNTSNSYLPQPARQGSRYEQHSSSEPPSVCNLPSALASTQTHSEFSPAIEGKSRMMLGNSCDMHGTNMQRQRKQQQQKDPISELNPYGCDIPGCYASFPQSSGLFYHMKTAHPSLEGYDKPYRCAIPNCSKRYKNINGLQYHLREAKGSSGHALGGRRASVEAITTR